jgi:hypothetical protein
MQPNISDKVCSVCMITHPLSNFYTRSSICKQCKKIKADAAKERRISAVKPNITAKMCTKCNTVKICSEYYASSTRTDGYLSMCKICVNNEYKIRIAKNAVEVKIPDKKICKHCNIEKETSQFNKLTARTDGISTYCKDCIKIRLKEKECVFFSDPKNIRICNTCSVSKQLSEFRQNKKGDRYFKICLKCWEPRKWTKEKQHASERKYVLNNPDKMREKHKKMSSNINRNIRGRLNNRIKAAFKLKGQIKNKHTIEYVGCTPIFLKKWFEFQFTDKMNWNTMKLWHIDHVRPCSSFDLSKESDINMCFNWKNIRPCLISENLEKSSRIDDELIRLHNQKAEEFEKINPLPTQPGNRVEGTE